MSNPFVGEIRMFGGNFAPVGWFFCNGQLLSISEYDTLYTLIGTTYGGDGVNTFALPDLRGRLPIHQGQGPGLTNRVLAQSFGTETVTLISTQIPSHNHALVAAGAATTNRPTNATYAQSENEIYVSSGSYRPLANNAVGLTGGNQPHSNLMPSLAVSFIISAFGIYPTQS